MDTLRFPVLDEKQGEYFRVTIAGVPLCVDLEAGARGQQPNQIGVTVSHMGFTREGLRARGLQFTEGRRADQSWVTVRDPDGNEIIFLEEK